jgi:hypothetical protein
VREPPASAHTYATEYVYCDKCGSFSIAKSINITRWVLVATLLIAIPTLVAVNSLSLTNGMGCFFGLLSFYVMFVLPHLHGHSHECRKCMNGDITEDNVLNYPSLDSSILDVPDRLTHKHYSMY